MLNQQERDDGQINVENIGGINSADVDFSSGVNILTGRNATNRTSLLQAIRAGLGSRKASLKADAESGCVELSFGEDTYTRQLETSGQTISFSGGPLLEDSEDADLFAFLLEDNEARRTVVQDGDLREIIMRPIDTVAIQSEIDQLMKEKREIEAQLEEIEHAKSELPSLEEQKKTLLDTIEQKEKEIEIKKQEIADFDANVEETEEEKEKREQALGALQDARSNLESVKRQIRSENESIEALEEEHESVREEYDSLEIPETDVSELEREISNLRDRRQRIESRINQLQNIIEFNSDMLDQDPELSQLASSAGEERDTITDQLLESGDELTCWTCGSDVSSRQVNETIDRLRDIHEDMIAERNELTDQLETIQSKRKEITEKTRRKEKLEQTLEDIESEIEDREQSISNYQERKDALEVEVEECEQRVEELEEVGSDDQLQLQRELTELEVNVSSLQSELNEITGRMKSVEAEVERGDKLQDNLDSINADLGSLRSKIDDLEREAVESFNENMETVLEILNYENIERIWIERVKTGELNGSKNKQTNFDIHIVRENEEGKSYEDTIEHLSESEREVTGLIFALAGFLTHDVYKKCPVILLDSLEAVDSDRIAALVEYFSKYVDYLFVALLPEDSDALPSDYNRISQI